VIKNQLKIVSLKDISTIFYLSSNLYPSHFKMQGSAGIRNVFRQGIDWREWLFPCQNK